MAQEQSQIDPTRVNCKSNVRNITSLFCSNFCTQQLVRVWPHRPPFAFKQGRISLIIMVAHSSKLRVCRVVKVGTDFTGMNSTSVALGRILPNKFNVVFSSEIQPECVALQKVMEAGQRIVKYGDVTKRSIDAMPYSDVYVWTPPCQSFSAAGKRNGTHDARGKLLAVGVKYTVAKMPRVAIMENVKGIVESVDMISL